MKNSTHTVYALCGSTNYRIGPPEDHQNQSRSLKAHQWPGNFFRNYFLEYVTNSPCADGAESRIIGHVLFMRVANTEGCTWT